MASWFKNRNGKLKKERKNKKRNKNKE